MNQKLFEICNSQSRTYVYNNTGELWSAALWSDSGLISKSDLDILLPLLEQLPKEYIIGKPLRENYWTVSLNGKIIGYEQTAYDAILFALKKYKQRKYCFLFMKPRKHYVQKTI